MRFLQAALKVVRGDQVLQGDVAGQRLLEGIEITQAIRRGELRATIGDGDLAIKRSPFEAAR